jgi:acetolactate synthase-1/3 small subunit
VLELRVRNHPGVLSHIAGLFARRAFNLEGILCMPVEGAAESRMWLLVREDGRLEQVEKQLRKLEDVRAVGHHNAEHAVFLELEAFFRGGDA